MTISIVHVLIALAGLALVILAHTAALFFWGGKTSKLLEVLEKEVVRIRDWKHDEVSQDLTQLKLRVGLLENILKIGDQA